MGNGQFIGITSCVPPWLLMAGSGEKKKRIPRIDTRELRI